MHIEIDVGSFIFSLTDNVIIDQGGGNDLPSVQTPLHFGIASDTASDIAIDVDMVVLRNSKFGNMAWYYYGIQDFFPTGPLSI